MPFIKNPSRTGFHIAFPDVCRIPAPPGPIPIPYPTEATRARRIQASKVASAKVTPGSNAFTRSFGDAPSFQGDPKAQAEVVALKGRLGRLNHRLQSLQSADPAEWQIVLEEYAVVTSALFVTIHG